MSQHLMGPIRCIGLYVHALMCVCPRGGGRWLGVLVIAQTEIANTACGSHQREASPRRAIRRPSRARQTPRANHHAAVAESLSFEVG
eukprot:1120519-Pyramimonas_sp.AAC.1